MLTVSLRLLCKSASFTSIWKIDHDLDVAIASWARMLVIFSTGGKVSSWRGSNVTSHTLYWLSDPLDISLTVYALLHPIVVVFSGLGTRSHVIPYSLHLSQTHVQQLAHKMREQKRNLKEQNEKV